MPTIDERVWFAETFYVTKYGRPFSLKKRRWVVDEFWKPADGWKLAARNPERLCDACRKLIVTTGIIDQWSSKLVKRLERHRAKGCDGATLEPIIVTILNLPRREGKSTNCAGYNLSTIALSKHKSILYVAAAGDQTRRILRDCYVTPIDQNAKLSREFEVIGDRIVSKKTRSEIQVAETSHRSITGSGYSHVVFDEARDVPPRVLAAAVNSTPDQNGWECPHGCYHCGSDAEDRPSSCPTCGSELHPWYARVIIMSSSGIIVDNDQDWFTDLVELSEINVSKFAHLYKLEKSTNPSVSTKIKDALGEVLGVVPALATYMDVELTNRPRRLGDDFLPGAQMKRIVKDALKSRDADERPCVGFLDTSWSGDITSLVILADDVARSKTPWQHLQQVHLWKWKPKELPGGHIDPSAIFEHFDRVIPMFPNLRLLYVDTRGMEWARAFVADVQRSRPGWGRRVEAFDGGTANRLARDTSWQLFEQRGLSGTIELINDADQVAELKGVRRVSRPDGSYEIRDRNRKKRHADILEGVAGSCLAAYRVASQPTITLAQTERSGASGILARIWKPATGGLRPEDF